MITWTFKTTALVLLTVFVASFLLFNTYSHAYPQASFMWGAISPSNRIFADGHIDFRSYGTDKMGSYVTGTSEYYFVTLYLNALVSIVTSLSPEMVMSLPLLYLFSGIAFYILALKLIKSQRYAYLALVLFMFGDAWYLIANRVEYTFPIAMFLILCLLNCFHSYFNKNSIKNSIAIIFLMGALIFTYYSLAFYFLFISTGFFVLGVICPIVRSRLKKKTAHKKPSFIPLFLISAISIISYTLLLSPIANDVLFLVEIKPSPFITAPSIQWTTIRPLLMLHMAIMILASLPAFVYSLWQVLKKNYSVSEFSIVALGLSATGFFASMFTQSYFGMRGFIYSYFLMAILSVLSFKLFAERLDGFKAASSKFLSSKAIVNLKRLIVPLLLVFIALNIGIAFQAYPSMQNADVYSTEETVAGAAWVNATTSNLRITTTMDYASILYGSFNFNNLIFVPESQNRTSDVSQLLFWPQGQSDVVQVMSQYDIDSIVMGNRAIEFGFRYGREFRDPIPSSTVTYYEGFMNVVYSNGETTVYEK